MNRHRAPQRRDNALIVAYIAALVAVVAGATVAVFALSDLIFWEHGGVVAGAGWAMAVGLAVFYGAMSHIANRREQDNESWD